MKVAIAFIYLFAFSINLYSATIFVPGNYPTIQSAVNAASNGDKVLVDPGTYVENIVINNSIFLQSTSGPEVTIIDGNRLNTVISMNPGTTTTVDGFTITNGYAYFGGGVSAEGSLEGTLIRNNIIEGNASATSGFGGGIVCLHGHATILDNTIRLNDAPAGGGVGIYTLGANSKYLVDGNVVEHNSAEEGGGIWIYSYPSEILISNNIIQNNESTSSSGGGGINCTGDTSIISRNTIRNNTAQQQGGGICASDVNALIINNIIYGNYVWGTYTENSPVGDAYGGGIATFMSSGSSTRMVNNLVYDNTVDGGGVVIPHGAGIYSEYGLPLENSIIWNNHGTAQVDGYMFTTNINFCCVQGGTPYGSQNISVDPLFVDSLNHDFHLTAQSPCRDSGDNSAVTELYDFEGDPRIAWGGTVDMGPDEFYPHLYYTGDATPGGDIQGMLIGIPETWPVGLFFSSGVREAPWHHQWGDFWLEEPWFVVPLIPIPANGVLVMPITIPFDPPAPWDLPMQGLVGLNSDSLTNLCVLEVR